MLTKELKDEYTSEITAEIIIELLLRSLEWNALFKINYKTLHKYQAVPLFKYRARDVIIVLCNEIQIKRRI